jgi:hypothetical protein
MPLAPLPKALRVVLPLLGLAQHRDKAVVVLIVTTVATVLPTVSRRRRATVVVVVAVVVDGSSRATSACLLSPASGSVLAHCPASNSSPGSVHRSSSWRGTGRGY